MKVNFDYDVTYLNSDDANDIRVYASRVDYFSARYHTIVMADSDRYANSSIQVRRYKYVGDKREFEYVLPTMPTFEAESIFRIGSLLGGDLLHHRYSDVVSNEHEAGIFAAGVENGIMRGVTMLQQAACNTSDDTLSSSLDDTAEELLIYAPGYHARWHAIKDFSTVTRKLEKQLAEIKEAASAAQAEYQKRLGVEPSFGILDLPLTRKLLEDINKM